MTIPHSLQILILRIQSTFSLQKYYEGNETSYPIEGVDKVITFISGPRDFKKYSLKMLT